MSGREKCAIIMLRARKKERMIVMQSNLGRNIKKLREARKVTQEQLAQALSISFQAVSKWETGVTVPDTLMLPQIAAYFDVTIDELFRPEPNVYANNAQRLLAVYEASHDRDDFIRADAEYKKLFESGKYTRDDVRCYGVLNEYQMYDCRDIALRQYEKLLAGPERDVAYRGAQAQRILLLSRIGRGDEAVAEERAGVQSEPDVPENHLSLMAALYWSGRYEEVLTEFDRALVQFGALKDAFHLYAGDACGKLGKYDEAFTHWERAFELDPEHADPLFSMALCFHERGEYDREAEAWERVVDWLTKRGFIYELTFPRNQLRKAREKLQQRREI